ncbi:MAG: tetratricopeptide repeat protein [Spartobacteria bacterium]
MIADLEPEKEAETDTVALPKRPAAGRGAGKKDWARSPGVYLFLGVFLVRIFALVRLTDSQFLLPSGGDMQFYNEWALRILRGQWTEHTAFYGLPLYAYLLAGVYKICGYSPFVPGLLQAACEGGTAVLLYKLGGIVFAGTGERGLERYRGKAIGAMAAIGWAFFVPAQGYSIILMPTAWLVFVFWFVVWQIVRWREAPRRWAFLALGLLIGFTAMGIATILFLVPLLLAALVFRWSARLSQRAVGAALILAGVLLGAAPASLHNYVVARDPVFLSAHSGVNFWIGNNPVATGYPKFPPGLHAGQEAMLKDSITAAEKAAGHPLKRSEVSAFWSQKASDWIHRHPAEWIQLLGRKLTNFWSAFRYDDISVITSLREQGIILPGESFGIVAAFGLAGLLFACWRFPFSRWIAAAVFLHMASLMTVFVTERYRLAAVPGLLLFASFGIWQLWQGLARARYGTAALFLVALFGTTAFVSMPQKDATLWALDTFNSGLQALDAENLPVARKKLDLAYAYSPDNAEINFAQGNLHLALGETNVAKGYYFATLRLDPTHCGAFNNLGVLALQESRWELASRFFRHALEVAPNNAKTYFLIARAEMKSGHRAEAERAIAQALELEPHRAEFQELQQELRGGSR